MAGSIAGAGAAGGPAGGAGAGAGAGLGGASGGGGCQPPLVINELQTGGVTSSEEFVELWNGSGCPLSLAGYTLAYSSASGSAPVVVWTGVETDVVAPKGYFLLLGAGFTAPQGAHYAKFLGDGVLSGTGGGIGLFAPGPLALDAVAYGAISSAMHPFLRPQGGSPALAPVAGQSISRLPNGVDTKVNAADFVVTPLPTPGAANQ